MCAGPGQRVVSSCALSPYPPAHPSITDTKQYERDGTEFDSTDYMAETPHWALKDAIEEGFDPAVRVVRDVCDGRGWMRVCVMRRPCRWGGTCHQPTPPATHTHAQDTRYRKNKTTGEYELMKYRPTGSGCG